MMYSFIDSFIHSFHNQVKLRAQQPALLCDVSAAVPVLRRWLLFEASPLPLFLISLVLVTLIIRFEQQCTCRPSGPLMSVWYPGVSAVPSMSPALGPGRGLLSNYFYWPPIPGDGCDRGPQAGPAHLHCVTPRLPEASQAQGPLPPFQQ